VLSPATLVLALLAQDPPATDAQQVMAMARARQLQRLAAVDNYTVIQTVNGIPAPTYFEKLGTGNAATFRAVPMSEWSNPDSVDMKALMTGMAQGQRMLAGAFRTPGQTGDMTVGPMNNMIAGMLDSMAMFSDFAAHAPDSISDGRAEAADALAGMATFARRARLIGEEVVDGRRAYLLRATGLGDILLQQAADAPEFSLDSVSVWLDAQELVPLRMSMAGQMTAEGRTTPVTIEQESHDYRAFGPLYEAQRQVMRITGMMEAMATDPRQRRDMERMRRDMERAQGEMARMEGELAKLPAAQRRMIEGRMRQSMAQMEAMAAGGALEMEVQRTVRDWNKGPPLDWRWQPTPP
jgi:hypothetical protein